MTATNNLYSKICFEYKANRVRGKIQYNLARRKCCKIIGMLNNMSHSVRGATN